MFHLDLPNVYKVLTNGEIKLEDEVARKRGHGKKCSDDEDEEVLRAKAEDALRKKNVVVVSIFGSTVHRIVRGGKFKRAFQLAVDGYGTASLYRSEGEVSKPAEEGRATDGKNDEDESGESSEKRESSDGENGNVPGDNSRNLKSEKGELTTSVGTLEGFLNEDESVLFLHIEGFSNESSHCMDAVKELSATLSASSTKESSFLSMWSSLNNNFCKWLLLLFSLSHVMILSETGSSFDTSYISLFRALDSVRQDVLVSVSRILATIDQLPKPWIDHARLCSPRLLFVFEMESGNPSKVQSISSLTPCPIKEKKTALQNEIYQIFRKCRIITNISANSLFAIPADDDFVFIYDKSAENCSTTSQSLSYTYMDLISKNIKKQGQKHNTAASRSSSGTTLSMKLNAARSQHDESTLTYTDTLNAFRAFLSQHLSLALTKGFDDDYRHVSGNKHFFVLPTVGQWEAAYQTLYNELIVEPTNKRIVEGYARMRKFINVDSEYLEIQCSELFPKVYAAYQRGLPEFYTAQQHQAKLSYAVNVFLNISRGPGVIPWLKKLAAKCEKYWKNGRQQCETLSLLGHVCANPIHRIRRKDHLEIVPLPEMDETLPESTHSSSSRIVSYCNCGKRQGTREEPFTIRDANFEFYRKLSKDCCDKLEAYEFPIFLHSQESTDESLSLQDMLIILKKKSESLVVNKTEENRSPAYDLATQDSQEVFEAELRQEDGLDDESETSEDEEGVVEPGTDNVSSQAKTDSVSDEHSKIIQKIKKDNGIVSVGRGLTKRSSSTVEYLPGMLHSKSPLGLLPIFPSWSLVCLGPSSIYSHSHGVHQSGFIGSSNGLLPWDVKVKAEKGVIFAPTSRMFRGRRLSNKQRLLLATGAETTPTDEFSVKVFFGFEYECRKGHRFFCESDKPVCALNYSLVTQKTIAGKVIDRDMPLYTYCPCKDRDRDTPKQIAQLIRIHIVTPKAPVFVTIDPKVLPGPVGSCPTFSTGEDPIKLSPSTYWIMRLPFSYVGDVVYVPPSDVTRYNGRLLKGALNVISMSPSETEDWEKQNQGRT